MNAMEATLHIILEMGPSYKWTQDQVGRVLANIQMLQSNGIVFDDELIMEIVEGGENSKTLARLREKSPIHYGLLDKVLDEVYEASKTSNAS